MIKKILWAIVLFSIVITVPSLLERIQVEQNNPTYEVVIPYDQVEEMMLLLQERYERSQILAELKEAGITSVSVEPVRIRDLVQQGLITDVKKYEIKQEHPTFEGLPEIPGLYLRINQEEHVYIEKLQQAYQYKYSMMDDLSHRLERLEIGDEVYFFFPYEMRLLNRPLNFNEEIITELHAAGFEIIPRLENTFEFIEYGNHYIYQSLRLLSENYGSNKILFQGVDVMGAGKPLELTQFAAQMQEYDYRPIMIDLHDQIGMDSLLRLGQMEEEVIRLFSMTLGKGTEKSQGAIEVDKGVRGFKERNIRMFFVNPLNRTANQVYDGPQQADNGLEGTKAFVDQLTNALGKEQLGVALPFASFQQSLFLKLITLIGVSAFIALFAQAVLPKLTLVAGAGMLVLSAAYLATGMDALLKGITLLVAIAAAMFAVFVVKRIDNLKDLLLTFLLSVAIALIGAWFVIQLLYGTEFITKVDYFRGVKVLAALPLIIGGVILFGKYLLSLLGEPVRYWHLLLLAILGGVLAFYVMRTGNEGVALPFELAFRQGLENLLYVRPRTTEFLIGVPLFVFGLYLTMLKKKYAPLFLAFGFVAFASMVGTFTHLHTPVLISGLRTLYSIVFGALIGAIIIGVYHVAMKKVVPIVQSRWTK